MPNRAKLGYQLRYALHHPGRIPAHVRRLTRDLRLRTSAGGHLSYYRQVMRADTARDPDHAVGSPNRESWLALGRLQFDYLVTHGLTPADRMLEIGCGNLRAGWRFIDYLDTGHYWGLDISPDILLAANRTLVQQHLQAKLPHLQVIEDLTFDVLPDGHFTVVHAHSVFSHSPIDVIEQCLEHVGRVLHPDGFFDFTFDRTDGAEHHVLWEDFYYRTDTLLALASRYGLEARFMDDWEQLPHKQSKIRIAHPTSQGHPRSHQKPATGNT